MILYPEVQERAREEIDSITNGQRLPVVDDRDDLPYLSAVMRELMRWQPVSPIGAYRHTKRLVNILSISQPCLIVSLRMTNTMVNARQNAAHFTWSNLFGFLQVISSPLELS